MGDYVMCLRPFKLLCGIRALDYSVQIMDSY